MDLIKGKKKKSKNIPHMIDNERRHNYRYD